MVNFPDCLSQSALPKKEAAKPRLTNHMACFVTLKAINWEVTVLPILAPMITPKDCSALIRPALTNPTTNTVVTEED